MRTKGLAAALGAIAIIAGACSGSSTPAPSVAPSVAASAAASVAASSAPSAAASSAPSAAASSAPSAAPSYSTGSYGTMTPLKPAVDLSKVGGPGEGALNIIIWAGYAEDGSNNKQYDWVHPFEAETGCKVQTKIGNTSDEMVTLLRQGGGTVYDGVSASGDATNRLIANGDVAAIDPTQIPGFGDIAPFLQNAPHYVVNGIHYGVPHGWGGNSLMYRTDVVKPAPTSWNVVFDADGVEAVPGQDHGIRQPDLHRRRGALPQGAQPGARDHRPVRADPAAVRRGGRPPEDAAPVGRQVLGALLATRSTTSRTRRRWSGRRGPTRSTPSRART